VDLEKAGGPPLTIALDADVLRYATGSGDRRVVAIGAEDWLFARRLGVRGGARFNTVGDNEHVGTAGASFSARSGLYVEGEISRGGSDAESGWGLGIRMTF
jgi:hypothetical protein